MHAAGCRARPGAIKADMVLWKKLLLVLAVRGCMLQFGHAQENPALVGVAKTMGAIDLKLLQVTGSGSIFALGQNPSPGSWVRYNAKSYTRTINYDTMSLREEIVRTPGDASHRGRYSSPASRA